MNNSLSSIFLLVMSLYIVELSSKDIISDLNIWACKMFILNRIDRKPVYMAIVTAEEKNQMAKLARPIIEAIWYKEYAPCLYCLNILCFSTFVLITTDVIRIWYDQILLKVKIKFYVD